MKFTMYVPHHRMRLLNYACLSSCIIAKYIWKTSKSIYLSYHIGTSRPNINVHVKTLCLLIVLTAGGLLIMLCVQMAVFVWHNKQKGASLLTRFNEYWKEKEGNKGWKETPKRSGWIFIRTTVLYIRHDYLCCVKNVESYSCVSGS